MNFRSKGSLMVDNSAHRWARKDNPSRCRGKTINMLPDEVFLEIFDFYVIRYFRLFEKQRAWMTLAHVCRRWRSVLFQSPRRLNLRLICTPRTRVRDILAVWPSLPLIISDLNDFFYDEITSVDNTIAALEHNDRVCQIELINLSSSGLKYITDSAAMQKPFPELTDLRFRTYEKPESILPDSFLDGSAPRLRSLYLDHVPFSGLPKLLLSATHLVYLDLDHIPPSGYIRPEVMATTLSALTNLESLHLHFLYPRPQPALESRRPPPPPLTRFILLSLTKIRFKGVSEYLDEILARIDAPRLDKLHITFFNQIIFDTPQLFQLISRIPTLREPKMGHIVFTFGTIIIKFRSQSSNYTVLNVEIPCTASEWQLSSLEQICTSFLPPVSTLEDLFILEDSKSQPRWQDDIENTLWLDLLHPFAAVKNIYLSKQLVPRIAPALQELFGGRATEVLPTLEEIFLGGYQPSGPLHEGIEKFVAARRPTSHPVAVFQWAGY